MSMSIYKLFIVLFMYMRYNFKFLHTLNFQCVCACVCVCVRARACVRVCVCVGGGGVTTIYIELDFILMGGTYNSFTVWQLLYLCIVCGHKIHTSITQMLK